MSSPPRSALPFALGLCTGVLLLSATRAWVRSGAETRDVALYRGVRNLVEDSFVKEVDRRALLDDALRGMLDGLDPYSRYYGPAEIAALERETSGTFPGIGVIFHRPISQGLILFPLPDSPAEREGVGVGDRVRSIAGRPIEEVDEGGLETILREASGAPVELDLVARDGAERTLAITPDTIVDPTVRHAQLVDPANGIGYLALIAFSRLSADEFDAAVDGLLEEGMRSLVLDLRGNPGGVLTSAIRIANRFVPEGRLLTTVSRQREVEYDARPELAIYAEIPLAVLIDGDSASASEVLAGALRDHRAAVLVGEASFGKGVVQTIDRFPDYDAVVKVTTSVYYTPHHKAIDRLLAGDCGAGIQPDLEVPLGKAERAALFRYLGTYGPPHSLRDRVLELGRELDLELVPQHPEDPQLQAALRLLRGDRTPIVARALPGEGSR